MVGAFGLCHSLLDVVELRQIFGAIFVTGAKCCGQVLDRPAASVQVVGERIIRYRFGEDWQSHCAQHANADCTAEFVLPIATHREVLLYKSG